MIANIAIALTLAQDNERDCTKYRRELKQAQCNDEEIYGALLNFRAAQVLRIQIGMLEGYDYDIDCVNCGDIYKDIKSLKAAEKKLHPGSR